MTVAWRKMQKGRQDATGVKLEALEAILTAKYIITCRAAKIW